MLSTPSSFYSGYKDNMHRIVHRTDKNTQKTLRLDTQSLCPNDHMHLALDKASDLIYMMDLKRAVANMQEFDF